MTYPEEKEGKFFKWGKRVFYLLVVVCLVFLARQTRINAQNILRVTEREGRVEDLEDLEEDEPICQTCNGSGEGQFEGTLCPSCKGKGVERDEDERGKEDG